MGVLDEADNLADMDSAEDLGQFLLSTIQGDDIKLGEALPKARRSPAHLQPTGQRSAFFD